MSHKSLKTVHHLSWTQQGKLSCLYKSILRFEQKLLISLEFYLSSCKNSQLVYSQSHGRRKEKKLLWFLLVNSRTSRTHSSWKIEHRRGQCTNCRYKRYICTLRTVHRVQKGKQVHRAFMIGHNEIAQIYKRISFHSNVLP